ncbi:hypothetical protein Golomagni_08049, partial [Golovinomyces magnicellulatus]
MVLARSLIFIFAALAHASKHELIVANFLNGFLYTVDFDDETLTLDLAANITVPVPSSWISFSHDKKNLYGTNYSYINDQENLAIPPTYVSYTVTNSTSITHDKTLAGHNNCNGSAIYIAAKPTEPYSVYGFDYWGTPGCGTVMSVDENGVLSELIQDFEYLPDSGVHGSAFNKDSTLLYAADTLGNKIWTQPIDQDTGKLGDAIDILEGPSDHAEPRHVSLHQSGKALYAVMEGSNEVGWYSIDHCTGKPHFEETYPLLPSNFTDDNHWANEVAVSPS